MVARARLIEACDRAKRRLSDDHEATIALPGWKIGGRHRDVERTLTRLGAEAAWQPLLERIRGPIVRALRGAGVRRVASFSFPLSDADRAFLMEQVDSAQEAALGYRY